MVTITGVVISIKINPQAKALGDVCLIKYQIRICHHGYASNLPA